MRTVSPFAMTFVVEKAAVTMVLVTPGKGRATVMLVVVVLPVPVGMYIIEYALVEPPTDTYMRPLARPVLATVMPVKVIVAVLPMAQAPPLACTVSVILFPARAPVIRAVPDMKASGVPVTGAVVKSISRVFPGRMDPAVELNPITTFWHEELTWHDDGMVTEVTWYPEIGPLGAPILAVSMLV